MSSSQPVQSTFLEMGHAVPRSTSYTATQLGQEPLIATSHQSARQIDEKFVVRLPDGMRDRIAGVAKASHRSMNSEIVHRIEQTFDTDNEVIRLNAIIEALLSSKPELAVRLLTVAKEL